MDCKDTKKLTAAFLDGELTDKEQALFGEHLAACQGCREEMEALAATRENLRQTLKLTAARYSPSPDAWQRLRQQITEEEQPEAATPKRTGMGRLIPRRLNWKTGLAGLLILALVISLAVTIPPLFGQDDKALAAEIALNNPEVQAALGGENPKIVEVRFSADMNTGFDMNTGDEYAIVVFDYGHVIAVVDLNTGHAEVVTAQVTLELDEFARQEIIDIAKTDPNVQELFDKGAQVHDIIVVKVYPAIVDVWDAGPIPDIEVNPEELIGHIASLTLELGQNLHTVIINVTTGKFVTLVEPGQGPYTTKFTTIVGPDPNNPDGPPITTIIGPDPDDGTITTTVTTP